MRMSCNGCRVLRKGCSDNCSIRPCLQWIKSPESQANATVFLAKFYGRAGLMNLINAGPENLRPAIFRSLLYEACGRIVNPIYGSVGLLWSGNWQLCQNAVEAILKGDQITQIASDAAETNGPPLKAYDIRHNSKDKNSGDVHRVRNRCRFKRSGVKPGHEVVIRSTSHESSVSHQSEVMPVVMNVDSESWGTQSLSLGSDSEETAEPESSPNRRERDEDGEIELELTLGFEPASRAGGAGKGKGKVSEDRVWKMDLGLDDYSA